MHDTAFAIGQKFLEVYLAGREGRLLEVGSQNVNGTLRDCVPPGIEYLGIDITAGEGVDIVLNNPYSFPFEDNHFDATIASSTFEHNQMFWLTFLEMVRVTRPAGYIYLNTPSNGPYHAFPYDIWRFYPDSGLALVAWAAHQGRQVTLIESFIARRMADHWNDCVAVFGKGTITGNLPGIRLVDKIPGCFNIRRHNTSDMENLIESSEDMTLLREAYDKLDARGAVVTAVQQSAGAADGRVPETFVQLEAQRARLAEIERERDERVAELEVTRAELHSAQSAIEESKRAITALQESLATRETALSEMAQQADANWTALQSAQAELKMITAALTRAEQEMANRSAAMVALQAEVTGLRDAVAQAERETHEHDRLEFALRGDIERLRRAALQTERDARARAASFLAAKAEVVALRAATDEARHAARKQVAATEAMRDEIAELRAAVAVAERQAAERVATLANTEREAAQLRTALSARDAAVAAAECRAKAIEARLKEALTKMEQERHGREETVQALNVQIAALRGDLEAARRVERKMMAALTAHFTLPLKGDRGGGWMRAVLRRLDIGRMNRAEAAE